MLLAWLGVEMANHPPATRKARWGYRGSFIVLGILLLALTAVKYFDDQKDKIESDARLKTVTTNQMELEKTFNAREAKLEGELEAFRKEQQEIAWQLATNQSYDPDLRQRIVTSQEKFNQLSLEADNFKDWMDKLKSSLREKQVSVEIKQEKQQREAAKALGSIYANGGYQMFAHAVTVFTNLLYKGADLSGDKIVSTYKGLPDSVIVGGPNIIELGTIGLQTNSSCNFEIHLIWEASGGGCQLGIHGSGGSFDIRTTGVGFLTLPGLSEERFEFPATNYFHSFDEQLGYLVANCDIKPLSIPKK